MALPHTHTLPASERLLDECSAELAALERDGLLRRPVSIDAVDGAVVRIGDRDVVAWCSNDYLGMAAHPALVQAAAQAAGTWGIGARASRLLAGTTRWHEELESRLAAWFGADTAVVFPSGYHANLGALGALCASGDLIVIDRLAHASLLDAARATRATFRVFQHNDPAHAASLLERGSGARRRVIVTEGLFSMDGDRAPLKHMLEVAERCEALVYLDDAHGAFVLGAQGRGAPEAEGLPHERFIYMGALGKALGCQGGFVIGPRPLVEIVRNRARTFIYTTALAVPVAAAAVAALHALGQEPERRRLLERRVERMGEALRRCGIAPDSAPSHIVPIVLGATATARAVAQRLWDRGIWAPAIRPPTVPEGTARLRLSVTALHTEAHIDQLVEALTSEFRIPNFEFRR